MPRPVGGEFHLSYFVMTTQLKPNKIKARYHDKNSILANFPDPENQDVNNDAVLANMSSWT